MINYYTQFMISMHRKILNFTNDQLYKEEIKNREL